MPQIVSFSLTNLLNTLWAVLWNHTAKRNCISVIIYTGRLSLAYPHSMAKLIFVKITPLS